MRVVFPELEQLRIELTFEDGGAISPAAQVHMLYPPARAFFAFPCPHSDCDGEFELEGLVRAAVGAGTLSLEGSLMCDGTRPSEAGAKRACDLRLAYTITAAQHGGV